MSATTKDKLEFAHAMGRHTRATVRQVEALLRYAATLQRLAEDDCNVSADDAGLEKRTLKRNRIQAKVWSICDDLQDMKCPSCGAERDLSKVLCHFRGCAAAKAGTVLQPVPVFNGDPRGCVLKIRVPSGYTNDFEREGICVPA